MATRREDSLVYTLCGDEVHVWYAELGGGAAELEACRVVLNADERERADRLDEALLMLSDPEEDRSVTDEFAQSGIESAEDVKQIFEEQFFFGCEADDPMNAIAFDTAKIPQGAQLRAIFASDIGHWDVPDFRNVLVEAWELVEDGHLDAKDFRAFTCDNALAMFSATNPDFFADTSVADSLPPRE